MKALKQNPSHKQCPACGKWLKTETKKDGGWKIICKDCGVLLESNDENEIL